MLCFENDYSEGAHPTILRRLAETNAESGPGYGTDCFCESARRRIREACACPEADVFFFTGGTQANQVILDSLLPPYAGVLAASTGHISIHEAGAIEFTGHKVLELDAQDGKASAAGLRAWLEAFYGDGNHEHMVFPGALYISQPTEYGTLYSLRELEELRSLCSRYALRLYVDGARLIYALGSGENSVSLPALASLADAFYIGGTKAGTLLGEAAVFPHGAPEHFLTRMKQHGALLAKGRVIGVQFDALFSDGLYEEIGRSAVAHADAVRAALRQWGVAQAADSPTNQIFLTVEDGRLKELQEHVRVSFWEKAGSHHTVIRLATGWATTDAQVEALLPLLKKALC